MVKINFGKEFNKQYRNLLDNESDLNELIPAKITLFRNNPQDTRLDNHALTKTMERKWAFSITRNIRIVYEWTAKTTVRFLAIGAHEEVY